MLARYTRHTREEATVTMAQWSSRAGVIAIVGTLLAAPAAAQAPAATAALDDQVRATERAFAKTMADRDHAAFTSFLADDTVFFGGTGPLRGKAAVAEAWKRFYQGGAAPFSWAPDRVAVLQSGDLALSSGPVFDPDGTRVSTFNSVWKRQADGSWKIVFDIGCPPCAAAPRAAQAAGQEARVNEASPVKGIAVEGWPAPRGHYAPAVVANGLVFVSGQLPVDQPAGTPRADLTVREQALLALRNMEAVLKAAGTSKDRVTKVTVFVSDAAAWDDVNTAYAEFFGAHKPARSVVPSGALHFGVKVEVEAIAVQ